MKTPGYLAGLWLGASLMGYLAAALIVFLATGQVLLPRKKGARLLSVQETADGLTRLSARSRREQHA